MFFKDKTVWITGASSGIGEALSLEFAKQGAKLVISSIDAEGLEKTKQECLQKTNFCIAIPFDLGNENSILNAVEIVKKDVGRLDILINNGGISQRATVLETPIAIDRKIMDINYFGAVMLTKAILPLMISNGGGHILTVSSISGKFGFPLRSAYAAAKHALHGFFETVRAELKSQNIKVTIACPGRVRTNISLHALDKDGKPHGQMDNGQDTGITAQECAKQMLNAIRKNKKEVLIGGKELLMVYIKKYFPSLFYRIISKIKPT